MTLRALLFFLLCSPLAFAGTIQGVCTYTGPVPKLKPIETSRDCKAMHGELLPEVLVLGDGGTLANVFVYVKKGLPEGATYAPPAEPAILDQKGCRYTPHVFGVVKGQTLEIRNSDKITHNVHGKPVENKPFNLGMTETIEKTELTFDVPEFMFPIRCDVHAWMLTWCAVMEHPFFAVSSTAGAFAIAELPTGTYEIEAWHERLGTKSATVTVKDGELVKIDFAFDRPAAK